MRAAVIGLGNKGFRGWIDGLYPQELTHVGAVIATEGLSLVGVADTDSEVLELYKRKQEYDDGGVFADYEKMMSDVKPEVVTIATPTETHAKIVRNVMRYDCVKAILLEKPIAHTLEAAEKILLTQVNFKVPILINHTRRWHPAWKRAHKLIREYQHGFSIIGHCSGEPLDAGIHMFDLFNWLAPKAQSHYIDLYQEELGKYNPYLVFDVEVYCPLGKITVKENGIVLHLYRKKKSEIYRDLFELRETTWSGFPKFFEYHGDSTLAQLDVFSELRDLASGERKRPTCSVQDGYRALKNFWTWKWGTPGQGKVVDLG